MKSKHLLQTLVLLAILFSAVGSAESAQAQPNLQGPGTEIVVRELTYWDATFYGYVDATRYEKWPFIFTESHTFSVTVTPTSGDLVPQILLLDAYGTEITRSTGTLISTQPLGTYFVQIQPESGSGFYDLMIRDEGSQGQQDVSLDIPSDTMTVNELTTVTLSLNNVPPEGYSSAEFICTYPPAFLEVSNIVVTGLFGTDPATAIQDPQGGSFIVAIAGSNGQRATTSGAVFSFSVAALQAGQAVIDCSVRVSTGTGGLTSLPSVALTITINDLIQEGTLAGQVIATKPVTINLYNLDSSLATSMVANGDGSFSLTYPIGTYTVGAEALGFLGAQGPAVINLGQTTTKATISLIAGDIDGNGVIDQFDAMTIGMGYNTAIPDAADLNADGIINVLDLQLLADNYRASGVLDWQ